MANNNSLGCYEVLAHVDDAIRSALPRDDMNYFVLGGVAGSAYAHPGTKYSEADAVVIAPEDADVPVTRDSGTRRDIDVLVDGVLSKEQGMKLRRNLSIAVGDSLEASVFGIDPHESELTRTDRLLRNVGTFVSHRYISPDGQRYYGMHPVEQPVKAESYEPWMFITPQGYNFSVLHPVGHVLAYGIRSIGGPRPKDADKIAKSWENIGSNFEVEALVSEDGAFHEWLLFANLMRAAREGKLRINDPSMQRDSGPNDLLAFRAKSKFMGFVEANQKIVDLALHGPAQKVLKPFVGTK